MADNPFAKYAPPGGMAPLASPPDPESARKAEDQVFQRAAAARADRAEARADNAEQRAAATAARAAEKDAMGSVEQTKAKGFLGRGIQAEKDYGALGDIGARSLPGQMFANAAPDAANYISDSDRQKADQSQRAFIAAILRYDSGAAIPDAEYVTSSRIYFPQPGDGPEVIKQKADARRVALQGLKDAAGPAAANIALDFTPANPADVDEDGLSYANPGTTGGTVSDEAPPGKPTPDGDGGLTWEKAGTAIAQGAGDLVEAAGDIPGLVVNPINTMVGRAAGYEDYTSDIGTTLRESLGLPDNPNPVTSAINKGGAGALTGSLVARGTSAITNPGSVREALGIMGRTPLRDMFAGAGAGAGGEVGKEVGGLPGQVIGTLAGGVAGYYGANKIASLGAPRTPNPTMRAADRLGVEMLPADVGGVSTRMATGAAGRTLGGIPIAEGAEKAIASAGRAKERVAANIGDVTDTTGAGQAAQRGAREWMEHTDRRSSELFENVSVSPETPAQLTNTRQALAELTQGLKSNRELSKLWTGNARLRKSLEALTPEDPAAGAQAAFKVAASRLRSAQAALAEAKTNVQSPDMELSGIGRKSLAGAEKELAAAQKDMDDALASATKEPEGGQLSWEDMKRVRSIVGDIIGKPSLTSDGAADKALRKFYGALTTDMEATAAETGPRALTEWKRAVQYKRGREDRVKTVLSDLIGDRGDKGAGAAFEQINRWAQKKGGDFGRLARAIRSLPKAEADTVRATIVNEMGVASPGRQNADGLQFSPAEFSTQWHKLSPRAKSVLFPNETHRKDLNDLVTVMDGMKRAGQFANFSNTALGTNLTLQGGAAIFAPITATILASGQFALGKLLASPRFARIIAGSSKLPPEQAGRKLTQELSVLATREPALASEVRALQQHLQQSLNQSPLRAAASEEKEDRRREPVN